MFYLLTYSFMTLGAFAVLNCVADANNPRELYRDFAGLGSKRPFVALAMTLFMLSLAGFPPLAGFTGKFYLFRGAVMSGHLTLAIIGVLNSLLSVIYYLRVIVAMYMEEGDGDAKRFSQAPLLYAAIAIAVIGTLYLGILPAGALNWSRIAFASLE
jgi:NADH-quinone oxidoreductase subunit N